MTTRTERRTQSRKRPLTLVYVELPPSNGGMMRDLSEQGFALRAMMPLKQSEKVPFSFILDSSARIDGEAIVLWVEDDGRVAALEFAGLPAHSRDQIRRWLEKFDEPLPAQPVPVKAHAVENSTFEELRTEIRATEGRPAITHMELPAAKPMPPPAPPSPLVAPPTPPAPPVVVPEPPPLLKLSSVRPEPVPQAPVKHAPPPELEELAEPGKPPLILMQPESRSHHSPMSEPASPKDTPEIAPARMPHSAPALEPLSSFEGETDAEIPGWMDRFTLGRAIGIMLLLTLIAGSFVYHRELGHALIWLGQQLAGDESSESSRPAVSPQTLAAGASASASAEPPPAPAAVSASQAPASLPPSTADSSTAPRSATLPAASESNPTPQLKDSTSHALVPLTQTTRTPSTPAEASGDAGQQEYLQALAILRTPNRTGELPEAVRLLWTAVEHGSLAAEIALADLYRTGRGVSKNCAQAKILLATAARKGSAEAQKNLQDLQREGCEE